MTVDQPAVESAGAEHNAAPVKGWALRVLWPAVLLAVALYIGCWDVGSSGPLWPDAPQYANAAAMIHDWLRSDSLLDPLGFALRNYAQYPGFHLPYHPPGYPAALALFFSVTGVSYVAARVFVALCLWAGGLSFYAILRETGVPKAQALLSTLLLMTLPEVVLWSRDTMSEIPGLAFILAGTYFFVRWMNTGRYGAYAVAFCLAEMAFLSRFLTAGVLPAWFLWAWLSGRRRELRQLRAIVPPALFLAINIAYTVWARQFSRFEVGGHGAPPPNRNYTDPLSLDGISFYTGAIPEMIGWWTAAAVVLALILLLARKFMRRDPLLWFTWSVCYFVFVLAVGIFDENRYFIYALPGLAALAGALSSVVLPRPAQIAGVCVVVFCICMNASKLTYFPGGLVGYDAVARELTRLDEPGNVLAATVHASDLMFRYRSHSPDAQRSFIRADRTLAIRPPSYTDVPSQVVARDQNDVIDVIRRGRIRYVVVSADRHQAHEVGLLFSVLLRRPDLFTRIGEFPLCVYLRPPGESYRVSVWKYSGELPSGPSELPVIIPTADIVWQHKQ